MKEITIKLEEEMMELVDQLTAIFDFVIFDKVNFLNEKLINIF